MGSRGPVPNRSDDLSRDRDANRGDKAPITKGLSRPARVPEPDPGWHPIARLLWDSAIESGQTDFYESSDYAFLFSICDDVSYYKKMTKRSGQMLASIYSAMETLLVTEGARRRVRVELQDEEAEQAEVVDMAERKRRLGLVV
ncbi:phage terminase small subunit [Micromonospora sp. NBC_01813]|uniref:phage terminase small subunit n=1 Tax=Micromonospora sp. NBC_01813 TaxID=2975988 RepID=UPI002DDBD88B|nr:hypothetical protein [Micromonospora sp. NBC_01813]WSA12606.1 hypothetical protein OG958_12605 [Micromonospora sp. NBC_01813]